MRRKVGFFFFVFCLPLSAQLPNGRNHPELIWRCFDTDHFRIIFHQGLDSVARDAAVIAEQHYPRIIADLKAPVHGKTPLILSDVDDISNGISNPLDHTIFVWCKPALRLTTGPISWQDRVIGHEFAHMATFWRCRNFLGKPWELITLGMTPVWFLEGIAQYEAETWDDHRNLLLRQSVLDGSTLSLGRIQGFIGTDMYDARLLYEQGHGLVRYISNRFGALKVSALLDRHRRFPLSFKRSVRDVLGISADSLYKNWIKEAEEVYHRVWRSRDRYSDKGDAFQPGLDLPLALRYSENGKRAVTGVERWDEGVQRLYVYHENRDEWTEAGGPNVNAIFDWSPEGDRIVISRRHRTAHGSIIDDLSIVDFQSGEECWIGKGLRGTDPAWSRDSGEICFVRHETDRSNLWIYDPDEAVIGRLTDTGPGEYLLSPCWSPDGSKIAFSTVERDGRRDIAWISRKSGEIFSLKGDMIDDRSPSWSPDGDWIAFCRYTNGTPNIFKIRPDGTGETMLTDVPGGCFQPEWTADGRGISFVLFENKNEIVIHTIPAESAVNAAAPVPKPVWAQQAGQPEAAAFNQTSRQSDASVNTYRSWKSVKPLITLPFFGHDDGGIQLGMMHYASDPLRQQQVLGWITGRKRIDWDIHYTNATMEPVLGVRAWGTTLNRGHFLGFSDFTLWERRSGIEITAVLPVNFGRSMLSNHWVQAVFHAEKVIVLDSGAYAVLQPFYRPFSGHIHELGLGYIFSWGRPDIASDIHPATGLRLTVSAGRADRWMGSDISGSRYRLVFAGRQEMSWGRHVAAVRFGALGLSGLPVIQDRMSLSNTHSMRALARSQEGDRLVFANFEYRFPIRRNLGLSLPLLYAEKITGALWTDCGKAWGSDFETFGSGKRVSFSERKWLSTTGAEVRCRMYLLGKMPVVIRGGFGMDWCRKEGSWYGILGAVF